MLLVRIESTVSRGAREILMPWRQPDLFDRLKEPLDALVSALTGKAFDRTTAEAARVRLMKEFIDLALDGADDQRGEQVRIQEVLGKLENRIARLSESALRRQVLQRAQRDFADS